MTDFGAYLKAQREARGWTLRAAAARIDISSSRLAELERGRSYHTDHPTHPTREVAERIARAYGLPEAVMLAEAGIPLPVPELSQDAARVLALFESLPPERRVLAVALLKVLAEAPAK